MKNDDRHESVDDIGMGISHDNTNHTNNVIHQHEPLPQIITNTGTVISSTASNCYVTCENKFTVKERKCCRICLEEEDDDETVVDDAIDTTMQDPMIAPCLCKGSSKYVHRSCLNEWRIYEHDRAFGQCMECHYQYQLMNTTTPTTTINSNSFCNQQPITNFCFFISRDMIYVTIMIQLLIIIFSVIIMLLDHYFHWNITHLFDAYNNNSDSHPNHQTMLFHILWWLRQHTVAIYYLFGSVSLLICISISGSIIYCYNGCRLPPINNNQSDSTTNQPTPTRDVTISTTVPDLEIGSNTLPLLLNEHSNIMSSSLNSQNENYTSTMTHRYPNYYRNKKKQTQKRRKHDDDTHTNDTCCSFCTKYPCCCCDTTNCCCDIISGCHNTNQDVCTCCSGCSSCHTIGDDISTMLLVIILFCIIMALIGILLIFILGVIVFQRIVQRHLYIIQKKKLVHEFQVMDISQQPQHSYDGQQQPQSSDVLLFMPTTGTSSPSSPSTLTLHPHDKYHLQKLGLLMPDHDDTLKKRF